MLLSSVIAEIANKPVLLVASSPVHVDDFLILSVYTLNSAAGKCELLKKHKVFVEVILKNYPYKTFEPNFKKMYYFINIC